MLKKLNKAEFLAGEFIEAWAGVARNQIET
jgi:hypothetical protein